MQNSGCDATASEPDIGFSLPTFSFPKEKVGEAGEAAVPLLHHNIATFQVMLTRAQAALGVARLVEDTRAEGVRYSMVSSKVAALLQAELWIARELRQWLKLLAYDPLRKALGMTDADEDDADDDTELSLPELMVPILKKAEGVLEYARAESAPCPPRS